MMKRLIMIFGLLGCSAALADENMTLWYEQPAKHTMNEALPVGNGKFGGLIHGDPAVERVVLNEISLWTGDETTATGDYAKMGAYQMLGELFVDAALKPGAPSVPRPTAACTSGHVPYVGQEGVGSAADGNSGTKWCVEPRGKPVVWELTLPVARAISQYSFTSAGDVPNRDPSTWELAGSKNGKDWVTLDRHANEPSMSKRGETKSYSFQNAEAFTAYKLTFVPTPGVSHFQVAEIAIPGVTMGDGKAEAAKTDGYRRSLDLATAVHTVTWKSEGVTFTRETFASAPDQVLVMRLSADKAGACGGAVRLKGAHREATTVEGAGLVFSGMLTNNLKYECRVAVVGEGGKVQAGEAAIEFKACDSVLIICAAATDYSFDYARRYRGDNPGPVVGKRIAAASARKYDALKAAHIADFQALFNRVVLDVGATPADRLALPIDQRKVLQAEKGGDPDLEELMFQYGRYLMISCSRPGGLPANLQGLWNDSNNPPWHSDYHANINVQMNYWPAEPANLAECHTTLFDLIVSQLEPWRKATAGAKEFQTGSGKSVGWAVRTSHGINGDMGWQWDVTANAWYCQHFWWHYAYGGDKEWLRKVAYPVLKETCEFWEIRMKALPDGSLVVPNGWSPEHGPHEDGVSYCQEIAWDLFNNYVAASEALGVDAEYRAKIAAMRDRLLVPKIGKWGQLQEWMTDRDDPNDHHRHTSHLFGVFPGEQFSVAKTPDLAAAAKKSLDARGAVGDVREWSFAWRTALYARLHDAESAHSMFRNLFSKRNSCPNLFGLHPPMQMDGNFGITGGVCEMLMQSYAGEIDLIPAIPAVWASGSVKGLRARGGFTVDIAWKDGKVTTASIHSTAGTLCRVRAGARTAEFKLEPGKSITLDSILTPRAE